MNEELLTQRQRVQEVRRLKWQSVRSIVLLCLACLCVFFGGFSQEGALTSLPKWSQYVIAVSFAILCVSSITLLSDIFKTHDRLKRLR